MHVLIAALLGFGAAFIVNRLADHLPARRYNQLARRNPFSSAHSLPPVPPLVPRAPLSRWFGITSVASGALSKRTARYLALEIALSAIFALLAHVYGLYLPVSFFYIYAALFALIAIVDIEHRWVLPSTLIALTACAILEWLFFGWRNVPHEMVRGALNGFALGMCLWLLGLAHGKLRKIVCGKAARRTVFGLGDVWLLSACGVLIGGEYILFALLFAMLSGGVAAFGAVLQRLLSRRRGQRRGVLAIPYAPHILIGTAVWLYAPAAATQLLRSLVLG